MSEFVHLIRVKSASFTIVPFLHLAEDISGVRRVGLALYVVVSQRVSRRAAKGLRSFTVCRREKAERATKGASLLKLKQNVMRPCSVAI